MILAYYDKQPGEICDYDVDFAEFLRDGESTSSATAATAIIGDTAASDLLVDSTTVSPAAVRVRLSGGTDGRRYKCTVTTTTSSGRVDQSEFVVRVAEV
jgi:hypothetical protein